MAHPDPAEPPPFWTALVDDAAIFPPGNADLTDAAAAYVDRRGTAYADLVGTFVLRDTDVPKVAVAPDVSFPVSVVVTGGAGQIAGPAKACERSNLTLAGMEIALRDLDDLAGNARRVVAAVDAARGEGVLDDAVPVFVELPPGEPTYQWLAAADEVAAAELRLKFRTGGVEADQYPQHMTVARWITAALDRETPFKCTAGLHHALPYADEEHGAWHQGFLNVLLATRACFDGADLTSVGHILDETHPEHLLEAVTVLGADGLAGARRWFTSFGSCSVTEPLDDLIALGLISTPSIDGTEAP